MLEFYIEQLDVMLVQQYEYLPMSLLTSEPCLSSHQCQLDRIVSHRGEPVSDGQVKK